MLKRIFISINFSEETKNKLFDYQKQIEKLFTLHRSYSGAGPCKWVKKENLHLTLAFLGNVSEQELNLVFEAVKITAENNNPFSIFFEKTSYGPDKKLPPRLVWVKGKKSEQLSKLKQDLDKLLSEKINYKPDKREFLPHITLARINKWNWKKIEPDERPNIEIETPFEIKVNSIEVMESHLKTTGAEYEIVASYNLKRET